MRYLITTKNEPPFLTRWFEYENHFNPELGMIIYDLSANTYTTDGINWLEIEIDHL
jgi:hypothetical protein